MNNRIASLAITLILLGCYYPVIFAGLNSLDDFRMVSELPQSGNLDLNFLFNPANAIGYFRPLVILSYYIDNTVLGLTPENIHLENITIHLLNSLLLYRVCSFVFRKQNHRVGLAFVASCIFALHPLGVEAVAWISGRTDLLAALFVLLALVCICRFLDSGRLIWLWYAAVICTIGALAKETALFCLPALYLVAVANDENIQSSLEERSYLQSFARALAMVLPFILTGLTYLSCRLTALKVVTNIVASSPVNAGAVSPPHAGISLLSDALTTCGFYVKKLFLPLPLNFAITAISPHYLWLGVAVIILILYLCLIRRRNNIALQMMLATLFVIISAIVISRAGIAWTPYAERYMYLPTIFFSVGVVEVGRRISNKMLSAPSSQIVIFAILATMAIITAQRAIVWQNNLTLYQDTIKKSPGFAAISNELAIALADNNRLEDAMKQIEVGKSATNEGNMVLLYVNQASILSTQKKYDEAYKALAITHKGKDIETANIEVIKSYIMLMERDRIDTRDSKRSKLLLTSLADMHEIYYRRSGDTDHLYRAAQLMLAEGDKNRAHQYFVEVAEKAPKESMYKEFARKLAGKTEIRSR